MTCSGSLLKRCRKRAAGWNSTSKPLDQQRRSLPRLYFASTLCAFAISLANAEAGAASLPLPRTR
jgi:hypothetical protein